MIAYAMTLRGLRVPGRFPTSLWLGFAAFLIVIGIEEICDALLQGMGPALAKWVEISCAAVYAVTACIGARLIWRAGMLRRSTTRWNHCVATKETDKCPFRLL